MMDKAKQFVQSLKSFIRRIAGKALINPNSVLIQNNVNKSVTQNKVEN